MIVTVAAPQTALGASPSPSPSPSLDGSRPGDFHELLAALLQPSALVELAVFACCLLASAVVVWALRRAYRADVPTGSDAAAAGQAPEAVGAVTQARRPTVWLGEGLVDGVLFPLVALLLALLARWVLKAYWPSAVFRVVVPVLVSLAVIRLVVRVLQASFPNSGSVRVAERSLSWLAWVAVVGWVTGILPAVMQELEGIQWKLGSTAVSVRALLEGAFNVLLVLTLVLWLSSVVEARLLKGATANLSARKMAANLLRSVLLFVGLMFALSAAGIDLTALGVLGGALGVGLGFGLQKLAANYVSGFVILAEGAMRIGDLVKVDGFEGRISDITTRYTVISATNGREAIVPNEMMITQRVENSSLADPRVQLATSVTVAYGTDLEALRPALESVMAQVPRVLSEPAPMVLLSAFAADGLELQLMFWIADPHNGSGNVRSDVNVALLALLGSRGIEIPYPQRVIRRPEAYLESSTQQVLEP
jgi:small-conductance mechanosensitive channel